MKKSEITLEKLVPLVTDLRHKYHMWVVLLYFYTYFIRIEMIKN